MAGGWETTVFLFSFLAGYHFVTNKKKVHSLLLTLLFFNVELYFKLHYRK